MEIPAEALGFSQGILTKITAGSLSLLKGKERRIPAGSLSMSKGKERRIPAGSLSLSKGKERRIPAGSLSMSKGKEEGSFRRPLRAAKRAAWGCFSLCALRQAQGPECILRVLLFLYSGIRVCFSMRTFYVLRDPGVFFNA